MSHTGSKARKIDSDEASNAIEERLRVIIDTIPTIVWRKLPDGSADFLNRNFQEYTGLSLEDGMGWGWMNAFHPDDRLKEEWRAALAGGKPFEKEARLRRADGEYRWFLLRAVPQRDKLGNIVKWYGLTCDIEDRKRAEDRVRLIVNAIPTMAWTVRPNGAVDFVNQRWLEYAGLSFEEALKEPTRTVHPEDLPRVMEKWLADLAAGGPSEDEMRLRRADGEYRWFMVRTAPLRDERGNVVKWYGVSVDIEDRKRVEHDLRKQKEILQTIFDNVPAMIGFVGPDGKIKLANREWERTLGWTLEEVREQDLDVFAELYPDSKYRQDVLNFVFEANAEWADFRTRVRDGRVIDTTWAYVRLADATRIGIGRDVTERKRAEMESRRLIDAIPQQIWSGPPDGTLDYCNDRWRSYTGLELEDLRGDGWQAILHPDDRDRVLKAWRESVANGTLYEQEERHRGADGRYRWFLCRGVPLRNDDARIVRWYGTNTDIEDRKQADEELRQAEDRIRAILEFSPNWIFLKDTEGRYLLVNREVERVFRISQGQIKGKTDSEIFPPERAAEYRANDLKVLREGLTMEFEEIADLEDGPHTSIVHKFPLFDTHGNIYATGGVATDITERKRADEQLRRLSGELLRSQDEERRKIARDLHDSMGQDLVALATMLGQLRTSIPTAKRKSRQLLSESKALADKCIRDVRTLSYVLHPPVLDEAGLGEAIRDYVDGFTKRSGIQVELDLSPRLGRLARDIELVLFRVVQESLTNIQRHSGSQQAKIRIHRNSDVTLEISDTGPSAGSQREKEERRFEPGVGITGMQERVKLIGGRLDIDSSSHGTTVRVTIPLGRGRT